MSEVSKTGAKRQTSSGFLWLAWGTVAYFAVAMILWRSGVPVPGIVQFSSMLSGAVVLLGAAVAGGYVIASLWARTRFVAGLIALAANVACLAYFWASLP